MHQHDQKKLRTHVTRKSKNKACNVKRDSSTIIDSQYIESAEEAQATKDKDKTFIAFDRGLTQCRMLQILRLFR